jgi:hypothetical protein
VLLVDSTSPLAVSSVERRQYRALVDGMGRRRAIRNQSFKCFGHRLHHVDASFQLPLFLHRELAHIAAARRCPVAQGQELGDFGERKAAVLSLLNEADAPD